MTCNPALGTLRQDRIQDAEFKIGLRYMSFYLKNKKGVGMGASGERTLRREVRRRGITIIIILLLLNSNSSSGQSRKEYVPVPAGVALPSHLF